MKRRSLLGLLAGAGCGRAPQSALRVSVGARISMAPIYLAQERGYFREEGVEVALTVSRQSRDAFTMLAGGEFDAALFSMTPAVPNAIARGARARIVAGRDFLLPGCSENGALYYRKARYPNGLEEAAAWKGSRIAVGGDGLNNLFYVDEVLRALRISPEAVKIEKMGFEESMTAIAGGHLDMAIGGGRPGFLEGGLPSHLARTDLVEKTVGKYQYSHILFGRGLLDRDVKTGAAFLRGYVRGAKGFVGGDTPRFVDEFAKAYKMDPALARKGCRENVSTTGEVVATDMDRWLRWAFAKGHIAQAMTAGDLVDYRFQRMAANSV